MFFFLLTSYFTVSACDFKAKSRALLHIAQFHECPSNIRSKGSGNPKRLGEGGGSRCLFKAFSVGSAVVHFPDQGWKSRFSNTRFSIYVASVNYNRWDAQVAQIQVESHLNFH